MSKQVFTNPSIQALQNSLSSYENSKRESCFGCCFRTEAEDLKTAKAVCRALKEMRRELSALKKDELQQVPSLLNRVSDFSKQFSGRFCLSDRSKKQISKLDWHIAGLHASLGLKVEEISFTSEDEKRLEELYFKSYQKKMLAKENRGYTEDEFDLLKDFIEEMPEDLPQRAEILKQFENCKNQNVSFVNEKPQELVLQAQEDSRALMRDYPEFAHILLKQPWICELFFKWKREDLPEHIFIEVPQLAYWLIQTHQANHLKTHGIAIQKLDGDYALPCKGRGLLPWQKVIGPKGELFLADGEPILKNQIYNHDPGKNHALCMEEGFQKWNIIDWKGIDLEKKQWWRDLPLFKEEVVELKKGESPYRFEVMATYGKQVPNVAHTHLVIHVEEPIEVLKDGKVKIRKYSFGMSFDQTEPVKWYKAFSDMAPKVQYPDQQEYFHHCGIEKVGFSITQENFEKILGRIKDLKLKERTYEENHARGIDNGFSYNILAKTCMTIIEDIAEDLGIPMPTRISFLDLDWIPFKAVRRALKALWQTFPTFFGIVANFVLYCVGGYDGLYAKFSDIWRKPFPYIQHPWITIQWMRAKHSLAAST